MGKTCVKTKSVKLSTLSKISKEIPSPKLLSLTLIPITKYSASIHFFRYSIIKSIELVCVEVEKEEISCVSSNLISPISPENFAASIKTIYSGFSCVI